jgi:hypothetical protein
MDRRQMRCSAAIRMVPQADSNLPVTNVGYLGGSMKHSGRAGGQIRLELGTP